MGVTEHGNFSMLKESWSSVVLHAYAHLSGFGLELYIGIASQMHTWRLFRQLMDFHVLCCCYKAFLSRNPLTGPLHHEFGKRSGTRESVMCMVNSYLRNAWLSVLFIKFLDVFNTSDLRLLTVILNKSLFLTILDVCYSTCEMHF